MDPRFDDDIEAEAGFAPAGGRILPHRTRSFLHPLDLRSRSAAGGFGDPVPEVEEVAEKRADAPPILHMEARTVNACMDLICDCAKHRLRKVAAYRIQGFPVGMFAIVIVLCFIGHLVVVQLGLGNIGELFSFLTNIFSKAFTKGAAGPGPGLKKTAAGPSTG